jgi:hypothetical protein
LISELSQLPVSDNEAPNPGFHDPAGSSVYDSDVSDLPGSIIGLDLNAGTQNNLPILSDPSDSIQTITFEEILESFPRPPASDSPVGDQITPGTHRASRQVIPINSSQANISTLGSRESNHCIPPPVSLSSSVNSRTFVESRPNSWRSCSFREVYLPIVPSLSTPLEPEDFLQSQELANRHSAFPPLVRSELELGSATVHRHQFNTDFIGLRTRTAPPRHYRQSPLRVSSRTSLVSIASKPLPPLPKPKKNFKDRLKLFLPHLLC